jgi:hypothetical protein
MKDIEGIIMKVIFEIWRFTVMQVPMLTWKPVITKYYGGTLWYVTLWGISIRYENKK